MREICTLLVAAAALWAQFPDSDSSPERNPLAGQPDAILGGKKLFMASCSGCHGANAEGGRGPNLTEGRQIRRLNDKALFASIRSGVAGTDMPPTNLPDDQIWRLVAFVRDLSAAASESQVAGDPEAGAKIFFGKGGCGGCHMLRGAGGFLGPDLTDIGARRTFPQLRESLLKPSARIVEGFEGVTVTSEDGSQTKGVARNNNNYSIQILDAKGELHLLAKDKVREVVFRKSSLMPEDYGQRLSSSEIANVLAFLSRQSVRPPGERGMDTRDPRSRGNRR
jgi:cytochrome c oxidase cbb3-type subunit III